MKPVKQLRVFWLIWIVYKLDDSYGFDWPAIKLASMILLLAVVSSAALFWLSHTYNQHLTNINALKRQTLLELQQQAEAIQSSNQIVRSDYLQDYALLVQRQFYTETKNWSFEERLLHLRDYAMRLLSEARTEFELFTADWYISERNQRYILERLPATIGNEISITQLNLSLTSLHEGHIFATLDKFYAQPLEGLLNLNSCTLKQLSPIDIENANKAYLQADCSLNWYVAVRNPS